MTVEEILRRIEAAQGDPGKLALTTADIALDGRPRLREAFEAAAIPHWFDAQVLSVLLEADLPESADLYEQLKTLPMVESFEARNGHNVHEATRLAVRRRMKQESPERFQALSARAAGCWSSEEPEFRIETIFHRLSAEPSAGVGDLQRTAKQWDSGGRHEPLQALGVMLHELVAFPLGVVARMWVLYFYCRILAGRVPLVELEPLAREMIKLAPHSTEANSLAAFHDLLGSLIKKQGRSAEALVEFESCKRILEGLSEKDPGNPEWQMDLSDAHTSAGEMHLKQERLAEALSEFESSKRIMEGLTALDNTNTHWQWYLAIAHSWVGDVHKALRRFPEALAQFESCKRIMEGLTERDALNANWHSYLALSHNWLGEIRWVEGNLAEALDAFESYQQIMHSLAARDPANAEWQRSLAVAHNKVGIAYAEAGRPEKAIREIESYHRIMLSTSGRDPANTDWQHELAVSFLCQAELHRQNEEGAAAITEARAALTILRKLTAIDPTNVRWASDFKGAQVLLTELESDV